DWTGNCPLRPLRAPRRFRNPKIGEQLGAQPTPRFRVMIEALLDALLDAVLDAVLDPWPPFTFCCPQAIVDEEAGVSIPNSSPFSRSTMLPFTSTPSPPAPLAIRKAPSASVESIEPRPPRPCEVGRPKGRRRKNRRQSHRFFFSTCCALGTPTRRHALGRLPTPPPLPENLLLRLHRKLPSAPPASTQEVRNPKIGQQLGAQPTPRFRWRFRSCLPRLPEVPFSSHAHPPSR